MTSPVFSRTRATRSASALRASQVSAVRRHCHTIARSMGRLVTRSQTRVVSRWLVIPIAAMSSPRMPAGPRAPQTLASTVSHISRASCETQPGRGKCCGSSVVVRPSVRPSREMTSAVVPVVPWSMASRCLDMRKGRGHPRPSRLERRQAASPNAYGSLHRRGGRENRLESRSSSAETTPTTPSQRESAHSPRRHDSMASTAAKRPTAV